MSSVFSSCVRSKNWIYRGFSDSKKIKTNLTASASKLQDSEKVITEALACRNSQFDSITGYRIIDMDILLAIFAVLCCSLCFHDKLN